MNGRTIGGGGDTRPRTGVLIRHNGMGDLVWHAEYFRLVAATSRDGQVSIIAPPSVMARELLGHEPWVREVIEFDRRPRRSEGRSGRHSGLLGPFRFGAELAPRHLDRMVLFSDRPARALLACWRAGISTCLGYGTHWLQRLLLTRTPWIRPYDGPAVAIYHDATAFAITQGWCRAPVVPRLTVRPDALHRIRERLQPLRWPRHALAIGASETYKQWGAARFSALANLLAARDHGVLLLGGPAEAALAREILAGVDPMLADRVMAITDASVAESVAALSLVQTCIGNDTGMSNIAAAVGTPTFVVLGPRPPLDHDPGRMTMLQAPSLAEISAAQVMQRVLGFEAPQPVRSGSAGTIGHRLQGEAG